MIKTQELTPHIYYKESRDFQLFGRIYDVLFNYLKLNIESMKVEELNNTSHSNFIELSLNTLGFFPKRNYDIEELKSLVSVYSDIIKNKGSIYSIETLIKTVLRSIGESKDYGIIKTYDPETNTPVIIIKIKSKLTNQQSILIEEVLDYIMPIGVDYFIQSVSLQDNFIPLIITAKENIGVKGVNTSDISSLANTYENKTLETIPEASYNNLNNQYTGDFNTAIEDKSLRGGIKTGTITKNR